VIGAVLAVFGAPYVQGPPPLAPEPASRLAEVETAASTQGGQLTAIEASVGEVQTSVAELQSLSENLDTTVRSAVEAAVAEVPSRDGQAIAALGERLDSVAAEVQSLSEAAAAAVDPAPILSEQGERLQTLDTTVTSLGERIAAEAARLEAERAQAVTDLQERLGQAATRLDEVRAAASTEVADASAAMSSEIEAVRGTIESANAEIAALKAEIEAMRQAESRAAAAALLVRDIDRSIETGAPFAEPLERLGEMAAGDAALEQTVAALQPFAADGVPRLDELRESLAALADTEPTPEVAGYEWLGKTVENITALVDVRDKGGDIDVATGRLAAADQALREGDLATAIATVEEVAAMDGGIDPAAAEPWLVDARARLAAVEAQSQLDAHIRELLTATVN
jgi:uncharacterized phage infection (PIP) family protein YhgE